MHMVLVAQPLLAGADHAGEMDVTRGTDGQFRMPQHDVARLKAIARIARLTDPVHPEKVSMRAFDVTWSRLEAPGCPQSDRCAKQFGGWEQCLKAALGLGRPPRPPMLPVVACTFDDAVWALRLVHRRVALEQDVPAGEPVVVLTDDYDRLRLVIFEETGRGGGERTILPARRQLETALEARGFPDALRIAGLTVLPPTRERTAQSFQQVIEWAVRDHGALPTSEELLRFAKTNRISLDTRNRPPHADAVAAARAAYEAEGRWFPPAPPSLDARPEWHLPTGEGYGAKAARHWNRQAIIEALAPWPVWIISPKGPADRRLSDRNLRDWLAQDDLRPETSVVYNTLGGIGHVIAAVLDRDHDRQLDAAATAAEHTDQPPVRDHGPQPALEKLLHDHSRSATLPALLRFAQTNRDFETADLAFLGVTDGRIQTLLRQLGAADAILVFPPRAGNARRYRLARPLSDDAQRYVDEAPALDDDKAIIATNERASSVRMQAAYRLAGEMPPKFTAKQFGDHIGMKHGAASKLLRELQGFGSVRRWKDTRPLKKGEGAPSYLYEVTGQAPDAAVDGRRRGG